jgi:hypothetical protein
MAIIDPFVLERIRQNSAMGLMLFYGHLSFQGQRRVFHADLSTSTFLFLLFLSDVFIFWWARIM